MKNINASTAARLVRTAFVGFGLGLVAVASGAQEVEDGVLGTCLEQGNSTDVCICASLLLRTRLGDENYTRFGAISDRISEIGAGAEAGAGEMAALTKEGFRFFVPHGQAIAVCKAKFESGT